jgi:hypothetical protein
MKTARVAFDGAIHANNVTTASLGDEGHSRLGLPVDDAFHVLLPIKSSLR